MKSFHKIVEKAISNLYLTQVSSDKKKKALLEGLVTNTDACTTLKLGVYDNSSQHKRIIGRQVKL